MQQGSGAIVYYVFDVLEVEGTPVVDRPLEERREELVRLLDRRNRTVLLSEAFDDGPGLKKAAAAQKLEGIVAKKAGSRYEPGRRSRNWLKIKVHGRQEFIVAGYTRGKGRRSGTLGSLVLAVSGENGLEYVGNVGTGFTEKEIDKLLEKLRPLERASSPFGFVPKMPKVRRDDIVWVEPRLVCEVEFAEWTHDGRLRAPSYKGLREDKEAEEVRRELPIETEIRRGKRVLKLSNLDKIFFPESGLTKGDLLAYYRDVAPALVPHLKNRPFTMKRYPDGRDGKFFFQKDAPKHMPEWIDRKAFRATSRESRQKRMITYPLVNDELALLWMANMGCIDMNVWYSRVDRPERPEFVLFDLDPSPDVGFPEVVQVALARQGGARRARARRLPEDERLGRDARARPDPAPLHVRRHPRVRGHRGEDPRAHASRARHDSSGRSRSDAASSSTRTRTGRERRSHPSTRCGRAREHRSRRLSAGTR